VKPGDLVEMWGKPEFYGIILRPAKRNYYGAHPNHWTVLWQSGRITERSETLMEIVSEGR
jgi:hypothetical protein